MANYVCLCYLSKSNEDFREELKEQEGWVQDCWPVWQCFTHCLVVVREYVFDPEFDVRVMFYDNQEVVQNRKRLISLHWWLTAVDVDLNLASQIPPCFQICHIYCRGYIFKSFAVTVELTCTSNAVDLKGLLNIGDDEDGFCDYPVLSCSA